MPGETNPGADLSHGAKSQNGMGLSHLEPVEAPVDWKHPELKNGDGDGDGTELIRHSIVSPSKRKFPILFVMKSRGELM